MSVNIRPATPNDSRFISWVMMSAARSHVPRGIWEIMIDGTEEETIDYLEIVATTEVVHLFHQSIFIIAEVDGVPAAALSGYDPEINGKDNLARAYTEIINRMGWGADQFSAAMKRMKPLTTCFPEDAPGAWIIESVATLPEYRRQGLVDALLRQILDDGRANGHELAQVSVYIDNLPALNAYQRVGFKIVSEKRDPDWEKEMKCPGITTLLLDLVE